MLVFYAIISTANECFETVGWALRRATGLYELSDEVLVQLSVWSEVRDCLHMVQLMPLHPKTPSSLASFESGLVLPF